MNTFLVIALAVTGTLGIFFLCSGSPPRHWPGPVAYAPAPTSRPNWTTSSAPSSTPSTVLLRLGAAGVGGPLASTALYSAQRTLVDIPVTPSSQNSRLLNT
jgi:hypothetical protein